MLFSVEPELEHRGGHAAVRSGADLSQHRRGGADPLQLDVTLDGVGADHVDVIAIREEAGGAPSESRRGRILPGPPMHIPEKTSRGGEPGHMVSHKTRAKRLKRGSRC